MMYEVRLIYKDTQILNKGKEDEHETPVYVNVHINDVNLTAFMHSIEEKKAYWVEDNKGAFWTNPDLLRTVQAFPIMEKTDEEANNNISEETSKDSKPQDATC